jgi:hypothetical protein
MAKASHKCILSLIIYMITFIKIMYGKITCTVAPDFLQARRSYLLFHAFIFLFSFSLALQPSAGYGLLVHEVS